MPMKLPPSPCSLQSLLLSSVPDFTVGRRLRGLCIHFRYFRISLNVLPSRTVISNSTGAGSFSDDPLICFSSRFSLISLLSVMFTLLRSVVALFIRLEIV